MELQGATPGALGAGGRTPWAAGRTPGWRPGTPGPEGAAGRARWGGATPAAGRMPGTLAGGTPLPPGVQRFGGATPGMPVAPGGFSSARQRFGATSIPTQGGTPLLRGQAGAAVGGTPAWRPGTPGPQEPGATGARGGRAQTAARSAADVGGRTPTWTTESSGVSTSPNRKSLGLSADPPRCP